MATIRGTNRADTLRGTSGADLLVGLGGDDIVWPGPGDDTMQGGLGADRFHNSAGADRAFGGPGDDVFFYGATWGATDAERYDGGDGLDTLVFEAPERDTLFDARPDREGDVFVAGGLRLRSIERMEILGGSGDDRFHLTAGDDWGLGGLERDTIFGQGGADVLGGGLGRDVIFGGYGDDLIAGDLAGDAGHADRLFGGGGADSILGDGGDDLVSGGSGGDFLLGGTGRDDVRGGAGEDWLDGGTSRDRLDGGRGNDILLGRDGRDALLGGDGHDVLVGGRGTDTLSGGGGSDAFVFSYASHSRKGFGIDRIEGFERGLDLIVLREIDADLGRAGDQAAVFIGRSGFQGVAGELRCVVEDGNRRVQLDRDGDAVADFEVIVASNGNLAASDFVF